eukprot:5164152-Alexandrium_andersonii.AAC.1
MLTTPTLLRAQHEGRWQGAKRQMLTSSVLLPAWNSERGPFKSLEKSDVSEIDRRATARLYSEKGWTQPRARAHAVVHSPQGRGAQPALTRELKNTARDMARRRTRQLRAARPLLELRAHLR